MGFGGDITIIATYMLSKACVCYVFVFSGDVRTIGEFGVPFLGSVPRALKRCEYKPQRWVGDIEARERMNKD